MRYRWWMIFGMLLVISPLFPFLLPATLSGTLALKPISAATLVQSSSRQQRAIDNYPIGDPTVTDLWIDPTNGLDNYSGTDRAHPLQTVTAAWQRIPRGASLTGTGYRLQLLPGTYPESVLPQYWEDRHGTATFPIIIQAADGPGTVRLLGGLNIYQVDYLYLLDLIIQSENDVFHCEQCTYLLLRHNTFLGSRATSHENIKINQSQQIYLEENDIDGAEQNAVDFVAVQYGHIRNNHIHNADDWCIYLKGGSAYFRIEGNEIDSCGTGGFTAGEGTGFEYMVSPWLHYEAYDLKVVNNLIHDTDGAGLGVSGGYNILFAYNTLYRVGARSHLLEVGFGGRSCDGDTNLPGQCATNLAAGGWGTVVVGSDGEPIPNRHIYIYNNLIYNPAGYQSQWQHFAIAGLRTPGIDANIPNPAQSDDQLVIRGNLIWNGPANHPLGIEENSGCQLDNVTCNDTQLRLENSINAVEPQLRDPANGDYRPVENSNLFTVTTFPLPSFPIWETLTPAAPAGDPTNSILTDRAGNPRTAADPPGAYSGNDAGQVTPTPTATFLATLPTPATTATNVLQLFLPAIVHDHGRATPTPTSIISPTAVLPTLTPTITPSATAHLTATATATPTSILISTPTRTATATSTPSSEATSLPAGALTLITLGDSLTEGQGDDTPAGGGYPRRLVEHLVTVRTGSTLVNLGRSGWTSDDLINGVNGEPAQLGAAVDQLNAADGARLALVWIGSNDLWYLYEYNNPPVEDEVADRTHFRANIDTILGQLRATGATVIIALLDDQSLRPVVADPPNPSEPAFPGISAAERQRMSRQVTAYNQELHASAVAHDVLMVDFSTTAIFTTPATLADDGNHPNSSGYDAIATIWQNVIDPLLEP